MDSTPDITVAPSDPYEEPPPDPAASPEWLACLQEACELLWPPPAAITLEIGGPGWPGLRSLRGRKARGLAQPADREFVLVPGIRRPPVLVPADRRAAAAAVRHQSGPSSSAARLGVKALSLGLAGGLGGAVLRGRVRMNTPPGADTIEHYLASVTSRDITVSMQLGPARANRKPVLQLLSGSGEPVGFAKIGINPLTRSLVRAEHDSLVRLNRAELAKMTIPQVLHYDRWHGLDVLVLSTVPAWRSRRPLSAARLATAMAELAQVDGLRREPLIGGEYLRQLRSRLAAADEGPERAGLLQALDALAARADGTILTFGCWHGDWAPWNMANTGRGLLVWDWERFTSGVPVGFDALHHRLQAEVATGHRQPRAAAARCVDRAPQRLASFGVDARQARLTAILYLADLATRYLVDRQAQAGAPLGAPGTWLVPAIVSEVDRL